MEVNTNLSAAAVMLLVTRVCSISCEGVLNLRLAGALAHGLFPRCLGNRVLGHKMSVLVVLRGAMRGWRGLVSVRVGRDVRVMSGVSSQMTISSVSLSCGSAGLRAAASEEN